MKILKYILLISLFIAPFIAIAYEGPAGWSTNSTTGGTIFPQKRGGVHPPVTATSYTATTTGAGLVLDNDGEQATFTWDGALTDLTIDGSSGITDLYFNTGILHLQNGLLQIGTTNPSTFENTFISDPNQFSISSPSVYLSALGAGSLSEDIHFTALQDNTIDIDSTTGANTLNWDFGTTTFGTVVSAPSTPTGASATINYGSGDYDNCGPYTFQYRVYSYKNVGPSKIYSTGYSQTSSVADNGLCDNNISVSVSWSSASGADGYRVLIYNTYTGYNFNYYIDTTSTSVIDYDGSDTIIIGSTVTPNAFGPALSIYSDTGYVGIGTSSPSRALSVSGGSIFKGSAYIEYSESATTPVTIKSSADGGNLNYGHLKWLSSTGATQGLLGGTDAVGGKWGMFTLFGDSASGDTRLGEWDVADNSASGDKRKAGLTVDKSPSGTGWGFHIFTSGFLYNLFADPNGGTAFGSTFANGITPPANGIIVQTKIGVATTTPNNIIDVYSTTKSAIGFSGASGNNYKWTVGMDVSNGGRFAIASSTALGTLDRFVIDGAGDVGIGSTTPHAMLSVTNVNGTPSFIVEDSASPDTTPFIIDTSGNVGVGDSSPAGLFTVGASDAFQVNSSGRILANVGAGTAGNLSFSFVGDTNVGFYRAATDEMRFQTNGVDRLTINSSGNVGIGTTSPSSMLEIGGSFGCRTVATTTTTTLGIGNCIVYVPSWVTSSFTINLPTVLNVVRAYTIKNRGTGVITLDGSGTETIDGSTTFDLAGNESVEIISTASTTQGWIIN